MSEIILYAVLIAIFLALPPLALRASKRASQAAPAAAMRTPRQLRLNQASAFLLLPVLGYFAFLSELGVWPFFASLMVFVAITLLLRLAGLSWRSRLALTPVAAAASTIPGALVVAWPSFAIASISPSSWLAIAVSAAVLAVSGLLSILSFPVGYGERSA